MRVQLLSLAAVGTLLPVVCADKVAFTAAQPANCGMGCEDAIGLVKFSDFDPEAIYYANLAGSKLYLTSLVACIDSYCPGTLGQAGWARFSKLAWEYGPKVKMPSMDEVRPLINGTPPVIDLLNPENAAVVYSYTINVTPETARAGYDTEHEWDTQMVYHHAYGWAMYLLLAIMLVIGIANRFWGMYMSSRAVHDAEALAPPPRASFASKAYSWYRAKIAVPATFGYRHLQPWGIFSIPTRFQAILIFIYVALNFIWSFTNYRTFDHNLYWPNERKVQLVRYVADRTGIMSFYNLPLLWLLAGRNDVLMWLTGWSYASCNLFHRWVARVATIQAIVHSATYTWLEVHEGESMAALFDEQYWATGVFATVTMSILIPLSIRPIREKVYEVFLILHIFLALATLVLLFYHVKVFGTDYYGYLVVRLVRIVVLSYDAFKRGKKNTVARITYNGDTGLVRFAVTTPVNPHPSPGQYYFLYTPGSIKPWENHPFTLASWERAVCGSGMTLNFLAKPHNGATRRLRSRVEKAQDTSAMLDMTVLLEGPYGHTHPIGAYDRVLLIAGGSGITAILPYVAALAQRDHAVSSIRVVWAVKKQGYADDVLAHELAPGRLGGAKVDLFVSQGALMPLPDSEKSSLDSPSEGDSAHKSDDAKEGKASGANESTYSATIGRPDMASVLAEEIASLVGAQRLGVLACGPWGMTDDLRLAVARSYGTGEGQVPGSRLEYFEEAFAW